jgi:type I restriction-modification system DNA methylase subunit
MLDKNIRCGNSLISGSPLGLKDLFGEYFYKTNPFDWKETFRKIMVDEGGFDVVIGNPPYAVLSKEGFDEKIIQYLSQRFKEVTYQLDSYLLFMVQSARLSKNLIGFIIPNAYLANLKIIDFRKWLLENTSIEQIVMLPSDVFEGAVVDTTIIILSTKIEPKNKINILKYEDGKTKYLYSLSQSNFLRSPEAKINIHIEPRISKLIERILENTKPLHYYLETNRGVHAYRPDGFGKSKFSNGFQTQRDYDERSYHSKKKINDSYKIEVRGKNIFRYYHTDMREFVSYGNWLAEPRDIHFFNQPRIYVRKIVGETLYAAFSDTENIPDQSVYIGIPRKNTIISLKFFLGILNSKLMVFLFRNINNEFDILFPQIKVTEFNQLPIRDIDLSIRAARKLHDDLVALVDVMLDLNKKIQTAKGGQKDQIQRQIEKTNKEIDEIVYMLYNITEEEKKIIEGENQYG